MHLIIQHHGDSRSDGEQCRDWRTDDYDWLEQWGNSADMSHVRGAEKFWTDKLDNIRVEMPDGPTGLDAPAIPNSTVITAEPDADGG